MIASFNKLLSNDFFTDLFLMMLTLFVKSCLMPFDGIVPDDAQVVLKISIKR
jgi:hypothetical protein